MPSHNCQLSLTNFLQRGWRYHPTNELVTLHANGPPTRKTQRELGQEGNSLAFSLSDFGVSPGDFVATLMYNNYEHCLLFYSLAMMGACVAPLNRTERAAKLSYMLGLTSARLLFVDEFFLPLAKEMKIPATVQLVVCNASRNFSISQHTSRFPRLTDFNSFLGKNLERKERFKWPKLHEDTALGVGFTSGSTGNPKGVVYSHKSTYVHLLMECSPDVWGFSTLDCILPLPPMFHCLGWLMPYLSFMTGAKLILVNDVKPGADLVPVFINEKVTFFCGVPAVLTAVRQSIQGDKQKTDALRAHLRMAATGGTSPSPDLIEWFAKECGVELAQLWGMTEMNPIGTIGRHVGCQNDLALSEKEKYENQVVCGYPLATVEIKVVQKKDYTKELPWDGKSSGVLLTRGPHVTSSYLHTDGADHFWVDPETGDQWLDTGDIAYITPKGQMQIVDRQKDVIKTGGEWVSSKELENHIYQMRDHVVECCVVAIHSEKWEERPLAVVVLKPDVTLSVADVKQHFVKAGFQKFEIPDEILFWPELPHLGSGKLDKIQVRRLLIKAGIKLPISLHAKL